MRGNTNSLSQPLLEFLTLTGFTDPEALGSCFIPQPLVGFVRQKYNHDEGLDCFQQRTPSKLKPEESPRLPPGGNIGCETKVSTLVRVPTKGSHSCKRDARNRNHIRPLVRRRKRKLVEGEQFNHGCSCKRPSASRRLNTQARHTETMPMQAKELKPRVSLISNTTIPPGGRTGVSSTSQQSKIPTLQAIPESTSVARN